MSLVVCAASVKSFTTANARWLRVPSSGSRVPKKIRTVPGWAVANRY